MKLADIKKVNVEMFVQRVVEKGSVTTARRALMYIKSVLELALENELVPKNVAILVRSPKYIRNERKALTKQQQQDIVKSSNKYADFFRVLLYTGMRKGEICALTWNDINFEEKTITISKSCEFVENHPTIKSTKNGKPRTIPLLDKIYSILKSRYNERHSIYVFPAADNGPITRSTLHNMTEQFLKDVGFKFTLHQLRHTYCTLLYYSGISSKKAQQFMGHSSLKITLEIYTHLDEERENNAEEVLNNYINSIN